jgi:hypothetical protein
MRSGEEVENLGQPKGDLTSCVVGICWSELALTYGLRVC